MLWAEMTVEVHRNPGLELGTGSEVTSDYPSPCLAFEPASSGSEPRTCRIQVLIAYQPIHEDGHST